MMTTILTEGVIEKRYNAFCRAHLEVLSENLTVEKGIKFLNRHKCDCTSFIFTLLSRTIIYLPGTTVSIIYTCDREVRIDTGH